MTSRKLGQSWTKNLLQQRFLVHSRKGKEIETRCAFVESQRKSQKKIHERKVDSAVRGERIAPQKLYEAEAAVEARNLEKQRHDVAFREINQEFESQRFQLHQASR